MEFARRFFGIFLPLVFTVGAIIVFRVLGTDHELIRPVTERVAGIVADVAADVVPELAAKMPAQDKARGSYEEITATGFHLIRRAQYRYSVPQIARGQSRQHELVQDGRSLRFHSYHPRSAHPVPLVVLFHGAGREGLSMIDMWRRTAMREGFALLAPDATGRDWPIGRPDPDAITEMITQLAAQYPIDPARIYLFGHSNGAGYAQVLINGHDGPWQAAALHGGAVLGLPRHGLGKPVRLYLGDDDHVLSLEDARQSARDFARNGSDSSLVIIPGHTHWFYDIGPQIADASWHWFTGLGAQEMAAR